MLPHDLDFTPAHVWTAVSWIALCGSMVHRLYCTLLHFTVLYCTIQVLHAMWPTQKSQPDLRL